MSGLGDEDFEKAWAEIVADLSSGPDGIGPAGSGREEPGGPQDAARTREGQDAAPGSDANHKAAGPVRQPADPQAEPGPDTGIDHPSQSSPAQSPATKPATTAPDDHQPVAGTSQEGLARLFQPLRRESQADDSVPPAAERADWAPKDWADEGHFVPPPPPDLPAGTPTSRFAWAGALGGPLVLLGSALTGINLPSAATWAAGLATIAGIVTLVWLLPEEREDSGWDDGAKL